MGKTLRKSFNGRNLQQMTRVTWGVCLHKNSDPSGLSAPGPYTYIKTCKNMYKIRLQRYLFETSNTWAKWQGLSVDIRILSTKGCLPLPRAIYIWKNIKKMWIKSEFEEIFLNLLEMVEVVRAFYWHQNVDPKGLSALAPGLYTCIK